MFEIYGVCMEVCTAVHFIMLQGTELKLGMGVGGFESIFLKQPHKKSKVILRSSFLRNFLWLPNLVGRTPDQRGMPIRVRVKHLFGQRALVMSLY